MCWSVRDAHTTVMNKYKKKNILLVLFIRLQNQAVEHNFG